jgi:hypothetical protein
MNTVRWLTMTTLVLSAVVLAGCGGGGPANPQQGAEDKQPETKSAAGTASKDAKEEDGTKANLAKLSAADRQLAGEQKLCPITEEVLGDPRMGPPVKVMIEDQPVLRCCKSCRKKALADPDKTLAKVNELKAKNAPPGK